MAIELFANQPSTTVSSGGTDAPVSGTQETWTVASSSEFPAASAATSPPGRFHVADASLSASSEIIAVTAVSGTTWTVTRGADGTVPVAHAAGFLIYQVVNAGALAGLGGVTVKVPVPTGATATDTPNVTAAISELTAALANGPATLQFQDGTYQVDSNELVIQSASDFTICGTGGTVIAQAPNRSGLVNNTAGDLMIIADSTDFTIDGITIDGLRDTVAPLTPITATVSSGQPSVTVESGQGSRYLAGQWLDVFGGLGTTEQGQADGSSGNPLVILSITPGGGSGGGDLITFTTNLSNSYTHVNGSTVSDGFGPYACTGAYLVPNSVGHATVAGRTLEGEDQQNGLHLISCERFAVTGCTARNVWDSPIRLGTGFAATSLTDGCQQGTITGCTGYHGYDQGVAVWVSANITVGSCVMNATGWAGIALTGSDYCTVTGNQTISPICNAPGNLGTGTGIAVEGGLRNQITGNIITTPNECGMQMIQSPMTWGLDNGSLPTSSAFLNQGTTGGTSIQVSSTSAMELGGLYSLLDGSHTEAVTVTSIVDSTHVEFAETLAFAHSSGISIGARVAQENVLDGNTIRSPGTIGILLVPSVRTTVTGNEISASGQQGISAEYNTGFHPSSAYPSGDGSTIEGNTVGGLNSVCIKANGVSDLQILGNRVYGPGSYGGGIEIHGAADSVISGNHVTDINGSFGVVIENGGEISTPCARLTVSGNIIERVAGQPGLSVQTGDSLTITGNVVTSCADATAGMYLQGITRSLISGNICNSNSGAGLQLDDNGAVHSLYNRVIGNTCRDDGSGYNLFGGGTFTQQHGIAEAGSSNYNVFIGNECDANSSSQLTTVGAQSYSFANTISGALAGTLVIDTTAADIQQDGAQSAGSNGLLTDSGHVHPATGWVPADNAFLVATYDPVIANNGQTLTAGQLYLIKLPIRVALTITYLWWVVNSGGSGASSGCYTGLYSSSGTLLTGSSDIGTALASSGPQKLTLTTPQALAAGTFVWAALLCNLLTSQARIQDTTAGPVLNSGLSNNAYRVAVNGPGSTTVASGSNGGEISQIATWSSPSAGVLSVASTSGYPSSGALAVAASGTTNARITYAGISGSTFTGCAYVSGSATGTVATGGAVTNAALPSSITPGSNSQSGAYGFWVAGS